MSQITAHEEQRHKTGNHSNPERSNRIDVQSVELNPPRITGGDLIDRQLHRRTQRAHPSRNPPVAQTRRQRNHAKANALNEQTHPSLRLSPQERSDQQQQRNHKSRDIGYAECARDDRTGDLARVCQTKRSQHPKRRGRNHGAEEKRCSQPRRQQSESRQTKNNRNPF